MPVSTAGGEQVRWHRNGRELPYVAADDQLMSVPLGFDAGTETVQPGPPRALFATAVASAAMNVNKQQYMVSPDGQTFVMSSVPDEAGASPITLILNRAPTR